MLEFIQINLLAGAIFVSTYAGYKTSPYIIATFPSGESAARDVAITTTPSIIPVVTSSQAQFNPQTSSILSPQITSTPTTTPTLSPINTPTPSLTLLLSPSPTSEPSLTPSTTPSPIPTATSAPSPTPETEIVTDSKDIFSLTEQFANEYHVDAEKLRSIAKCESGFNPDAAYLDYAGLYQFSPATWASYRVQMAKDTNPDLRFNPAASIQTAAFVLSIGRESIWPNCLD